jgi:hypothetical protein
MIRGALAGRGLRGELLILRALDPARRERADDDGAVSHRGR